jgi:hypothetical protein
MGGPNGIDRVLRTNVHLASADCRGRIDIRVMGSQRLLCGRVRFLVVFLVVGRGRTETLRQNRLRARQFHPGLNDFIVHLRIRGHKVMFARCRGSTRFCLRRVYAHRTHENRCDLGLERQKDR